MERRPLWLMPLILLCTLALSACATNPPAVPQVMQCPRLPPVPAPLMQPPPKPLQTASKIQSLLFVPVMKPTNGSSSYASK